MYAGNLLSSAIQDLNCSELELFRVGLGGRALDRCRQGGDVVSKTSSSRDLQIQNSLLRKTLQEDSSGESYLFTVPGRGYRLVGHGRQWQATDIVAKRFCGPDR